MTTRKLKVVTARREEDKPTIHIEFNRPLNALEFTGLVRNIEQTIGMK